MPTRLRPTHVLALVLLALAAPAAAQQPTRLAQADSAAKRPLPLTPGRKVEFTTDHGSWTSLDVSPDGQTIVFDLLGDLYTLPIAGGRATRITSGLAYDAMPRFSPDGKRIAFVSDRSGGDNVWILSTELKDTLQLTTGNSSLYTSPEWTPDGRYVVVSKATRLLRDAAKLWLVHTEGGSGVALIKDPEGPPTPAGQSLKTVGAAFGADPRYVWYAQRRGDWSYNVIFPQYQLAVYDRDTGKSTVMSNRIGSAFRPALSPDGKWLVYGTRQDAQTGLRIRELATGDERWLAYPVQRDDQESRATMDALPGYSFTPDGRAIVVSYGGEIWRVPVDGGAPAKIPFTADVSVDLGPRLRFDYRVDDGATFAAHQIRDASPSPDGRRLAFTVLDHVYVMDWPNGTPRRLADLPDVVEAQPVWSPDGRSVAFLTWSDRAGGDIWRVGADGGQPQKLTTTSALYRQPAWSPDGRRIVALRAAKRELQEALGFFGGGLGNEFVWIPATGGDARLIAPAAGREHPHFTQDTLRIYASSEDAGLVSFRWDGTDEKTHLKVTGATLPGEKDPIKADYVLMSPRGDQAVALVVNDLYVVTVPQVGGPTPTVSVADTATAAFPMRRLTDVGGQFPAWSADGRRVHWSIGNTHAVYDLDRARVVDDSLRAVRRARGASPDTSRAARDSLAAQVDSVYRPELRRIQIAVARDVPRGTAVLRGARVVTMKGDEVIEDADVVVRDNRIAAVGRRGQLQVPADARVIDIAGKTIVPGFIDTHYHSDWLIPDVHSPEVWQYLAELAYGTTTTRDPQTATTDVLTYEDRVENGELIGPRIYSTGPGVFDPENIKSLDQARNVLRRYSEYYDTHTLKMYMTGNRQQRQWIIMAAKELGLMPTTEGGLDLKLELTHVLDGYPGVEHSFPIQPLYKDVVTLLAQSQTVNTPTLIVSYGGPFGENYWYETENVHGDPKLNRFAPHAYIDTRTRRRGTNAGDSPGPGGWFMRDEFVFPLTAKFAKDVVEAGGRVGVGGHGQLQGLGYQWEMWMMATGGMRPHDVLRAATLFGAEAIGMDKDLGSIEPGKLADLVVLDRNPLDDIRNTNAIRYVMKNGRLYEADTLNEIWPRQRALPALPWRAEEPHTAAGIR